MSMRISVTSQNTSKKPLSEQRNDFNRQLVQQLKTQPQQIQSQSLSNIYIRSQHISTRPKSPFRKYEQCIKNSLTQGNFSTRKVILIPSNSQPISNPNIQPISNPPIQRYRTNYTIDLNNFSPSRPSRPVFNRVRFDTNEPIKKKISDESWNQRDESKETRSVSNETDPKIAENVDISTPIGVIDEIKVTQLILDPEISPNNKPTEHIELNAKTVEQFIDLLISEDLILRKKILEGKLDGSDGKKTEILSDIQSSNHNENSNKKSEKKIERKTRRSSSEAKTQLQNKNKQEPLKNDNFNAELLTKIKEISVEKDKTQEISPTPSILHHKIKICKNSNEENMDQRPKNQNTSTNPKQCLLASFRDPAFSQELKSHPLVKNN